MSDDMTRLDALRALLAQHEPVEDDKRGGHTYRWPLPAHTLRLRAKAKARAKKITATVMTMAGWRTA